MAQLKASRTLVKSSPELWAECSDAASLARHLGAFGEIRLTKLEPETAVAWEGDDVRGTVTLEPSGWGTRVVLTARPVDERASVLPAALAPASESEPEPEPEPEAEPPRPGFFARLFGRRRRPARPAETAETSGTPGAAGAAAPAEPAAGEDRAGALAGALDSLGRAHHRPFSRG